MIQVKNETTKQLKNFWNHIHFHPTDAIEDDWGIRILDAIADDNAVDIVRIHAMFEDIVTMDDDGNLKYDFTLTDTRLDYLTQKGFRPLISYNFTPPCIAIDPTCTFSNSKNKTRYKGKMIVTSPPKDYNLWEEICYKYTEHIIDRYGEDTVKNWYIQCYNEPDCLAFLFSNLPVNPETTLLRLEEYKKIYRYFERGIRRKCKNLRIGGPVIAWENGFLEEFLRYVKEENIQIDYVSFHTYGTTPEELNDNSKPLHVNNTISMHVEREEIINRYFPGIEIVVDEWGAATCGFYNKEECEHLIFREDNRFSAYFGKMISAYIEKNINVSVMIMCLSGQHEMTEDFSGFRNFFTLNFIKKPIYNAYVLARKLYHNLLSSTADNENISVTATKNDKDNYSVLVTYASENYNLPLPDMHEKLVIDGVNGKRNVKVWCIDDKTTNPYAMYLKNGWDKVGEKEISLLRQEGILKPVADYTVEAGGNLEIDLNFTNNAFLLIEF